MAENGWKVLKNSGKILPEMVGNWRKNGKKMVEKWWEENLKKWLKNGKNRGEKIKKIAEK